MSLAVAEPIVRPTLRRPVRRGWRPRYEGDFPTLGWLVLDHAYAYLPSPANEKDPFVATDEQARRILEWFRLNPLTGGFVHGRRLHNEDPKGWGKSPIAGVLDLEDFTGPVCFDGWDANGQPVGVPWGTGDRPAPWIQVAAVSEAQTRNTYSAIYAMLVANDHRAARDLRIDDGRTRLYLRDVPDAILEPVTASAGSREGQRVTKATLDEPQLWKPENGGHKLVDTILGNLTKMSGRAVFTGNAYVKGEQSVAERFAVDEPGVLRYARRPSEDPQQDWPRERLIAGLREVYADVRWVNLDRVVDDAVSPTANWPRAKRLFWNIPTPGEDADRWMPETAWEGSGGEVSFAVDKPLYVVVAFAPDHRTAAIARAQLGAGVMLEVRCFADGADDFQPLGPLEQHLRELGQAYRAAVMSAFRPHPRAAEYKRAVPGPEIAYSGVYFEGSAQRLREAGLALLYIPQSPKMLADAAERTMAAVSEGTLTHDGDPELSRQVANVITQETAAGARVSAREDQVAPAAFAAMVAVWRALTAEKAPPPKPRVYGGFSR